MNHIVTRALNMIRMVEDEDLDRLIEDCAIIEEREKGLEKFIDMQGEDLTALYYGIAHLRVEGRLK